MNVRRTSGGIWLAGSAILFGLYVWTDPIPLLAGFFSGLFGLLGLAFVFAPEGKGGAK